MLKKLSFTLLLLSLFIISSCKISGTILMDGMGIENVEMILSGDTNAITYTNSDGEYVFDDIDAGSYTITMEPPNGYTRSISKPVKKEKNHKNVDDVNFSMDTNAIRETEAGTIIGFEEDNGSHAWEGVPYAAPPVDDLRWKAPIPPDSWETDIYLALEVSEICTQLGSMLVDVAEGRIGEPVGCEDCLYLNIHAPMYTPENIPADEDLLPVMVWIHGGSNVTGYGGGYHGQVIAEAYNLIVITINYRLGPFGWLTHPALETGDPLDDSGNYGTLDVIRALTWVQDNIENFGGNPDNVTVFGESAGSWNTFSMMISMEATGLFHKAIAESGGISTIEMSKGQNYMDDPVNPGHFHSSREVINNLLIADGSAADRDAAKTIQNDMNLAQIRDYMYSKATIDILRACSYGDGESISVPNKFRDGVVLPTEDPLMLFEDTANYNAVPLMVGSNRDETKLFMLFDPELVELFAGLPMRAKDPAYYELYSSYHSDAIKAYAVDNIATILSDTLDQPPVYAYRFDWDEEPTILGIDVGFLVGAAHGMEIPFIFNNFDQFMVPQYVSLVFSDDNLAGRLELGGSMSSYWAEFAYNSDPFRGRDGEEVEWAEWDNSYGTDKFIIFDTQNDGGIRMSSVPVTPEALKYRLLSETGFTTQEQHCDMYRSLFQGTYLWDMDEYLNLGAEGCSE